MDKGTPPPEFHQPHPPEPVVQQPPPATHVIVVESPTYGRVSMVVHCPTCNKLVETVTKRVVTRKTNWIALAMCIFQCWIYLPCIYCCNCFKATYHYCSNCNTYLGAHSHVKCLLGNTK